MQSLRLGLQDDTHSNFVSNLFVFPPQPLNVNFYTQKHVCHSTTSLLDHKDSNKWKIPHSYTEDTCMVGSPA